MCEDQSFTRFVSKKTTDKRARTTNVLENFKLGEINYFSPSMFKHQIKN